MKRVFESRILISAIIVPLLWLAAGVPILADDKPFLSSDFARTEADHMDKFAGLLKEFTDRIEALRQKGSKLDPKQIAAAEEKLRDVKNGLPEFQNNARNFVTKLKNAGKWSAECDSYFEAAAIKSGSNREFAALVKRNGGARSVIDKCIASFGRFSAELNENERELQEMKSRKVGQASGLEVKIIPASYAAPDVAGIVACTVFVVTTITCVLKGLFCTASKVSGIVCSILGLL